MERAVKFVCGKRIGYVGKERCGCRVRGMGRYDGRELWRWGGRGRLITIPNYNYPRRYKETSDAREMTGLRV